MQKAYGEKLGLLALLQVSHAIKGQGTRHGLGRLRILERMRAWGRRSRTTVP